jgi:hypothetical protein
MGRIGAFEGKGLKGGRAAAEETEILRPAKQNAGSQDDKRIGDLR